MIQELINQYNSFDGKIISRKQLTAYYSSLFDYIPENEIIKIIAEKIGNLLKNNSAEKFKIRLQDQFVEFSEKELIGLGVPFIENDSDLDPGLKKAVSPNEIYDIITQKVIEMIESDKGLIWHKPWTATGNFGEAATNLKTKNVYRGINDFLLNVVAPHENGKPFESPFFLSFKQIQDLGGSLNKGAKGHIVIYFSKIHTFSQDEPKLYFRTSEAKKFNSFIKENQSKINASATKSSFAILKYYKVFSLDDITGIELPKTTVQEKPFSNIEVAEAIVQNMPNPPKLYLENAGDKAFHRSSNDSVTMPKKSYFDNEQYYYSVLFHELIHATGNPKRLDRVLGSKFGSKPYAFEELIAEFGALFLCAEAGILYKTIDNSASYIKGWKQSLVKNAKEDNKFIFKAVSKSQEAADYILDKNQEGKPKYLVDLLNKKPTPKTENICKEKAENPEPFSKKPKSTSVKQAIKDVLTLEDNNLSEIAANVIFSVFKDVKPNENNEIIAYVKNKFNYSVLNSKKVSEYVLVYDPSSVDEIYGSEIKLLPKGEKLVERVKNRLESLKNQKNNYALFDGLNGNWHHKDSKYKHTTDENQRLKKGFKFLKDGTIQNIKTKKIYKGNAPFPYEKKEVSVKTTKSKVVNAEYIETKGKVVLSFSSALKTKEYLESIVCKKSIQSSSEKLGLNFNIPIWHYSEKGEKLYFIYNKKAAKPYQFISMEQTTKNKISSLEKTEPVILPKEKKVSKKKPTIQEKVTEAAELLKTLKTAKELRDWAIENQMDDRSAFPKFKEALKKIGLDYDGVKNEKANELAAKVDYQIDLYSDYKSGTNRFSITDKNGVEFWNGRDFDNPDSQAEGELNTVKKAIWLAGKVAAMNDIEVIKLNLFVDAQWLLYYNKPKHKAYSLNYLAKKSNVVLNINWIPGSENPADYATTQSGFVKWSETSASDYLKEIYPIKKKGLKEVSPIKSKTIVLPIPNTDKVVGLAFAQENAYNQGETAQTNPNQPKTVTQKSNLPFKPVSQTLNENKQPAKLLKISNPHLKQFLGNVEIKEKQSLAITLDSGEGGGKTHTAFQFAGETANNGYKTIVWSLEEHAESNLSKQKQQKYFSDYAKQNVSVVSEDSELTAEENYKRIVDSVKFYDVIVIDSWAKVLELKGTANFDQEFRKAFDGKVFLIIFQRTADGKMRGGAKGGFDADIVLKVEVDRADFRNNYVYNHKNRYNDYMPISDLKYSPYYQKLMPKQTTTNQIVLQAPQTY